MFSSSSSFSLSSNSIYVKLFTYATFFALPLIASVLREVLGYYEMTLGTTVNFIGRIIYFGQGILIFVIFSTRTQVIDLMF
jgi:hypothetical protein